MPKVTTTKGSPLGFLIFCAVLASLVAVLGVYVAGGTDVRCTRVAGARATCTEVTTRWLGRSVQREALIGHVTSVSAIAQSRTETEKDSQGRSHSVTRDDWSAAFALAPSGTYLVGATREQAEAAAEEFRSFLADPTRDGVTLSFPEWAFGYGAMGFGALVLLFVLTLARAAASGRGAL